MSFTQVILPHRPTVDRVGAYVIFEQAAKRSLDVVFAHQGMLISDQELSGLVEKGTFPIGVGKGRTYREREVDGQNFGSETSLIIHELRSIGGIGEDAVLDDFAKMMDRNNKDGYLVNQQFSVNKIVRHAYHIGCDPKMVVRSSAHVISVFLEARRIELTNGLSLGVRDRANEIASTVLAYLPETARIHNGAMSVQRYIRDMALVEVTEETMVSNMMLWLGIRDQAKVRQVAAKKIADTQRFPTFQLDRRSERGVWLESDDIFLMNELVFRCSLVVMRGSGGNIVIMSKRFRLDGIAAALMERETDWYYEPFQHNVLANEIRTTLSREELEHCVGTAVLTQR